MVKKQHNFKVGDYVYLHQLDEVLYCDTQEFADYVNKHGASNLKLATKEQIKEKYQGGHN
jgi:hypothetical protein